MEVLLGGLASVVAGLAAGYAGVHFALARTKKQRVAEARAKWYEDLIRVLLSQSQAIEARASAEAAGYALGMKSNAFFDRTFSNLITTRHLFEQSYMYASPPTHKLLQDFNNALLQLQRIVSREPDGTVVLAPVAHAEFTADLTRLLAKRLTVEYRQHMGMEPLDIDVTDIDAAVRELASALPIDVEEREHRASREAEFVLQATEDGGETWCDIHAGSRIGLRCHGEGSDDWEILVEPPRVMNRSEW